MEYSRCSPTELQQFIHQRGLTASLQEHMIEILQQADQARRFKFLELPPEIRNMVYNEVPEVSMRDKGQRQYRPLKPHLQALSVCKQIYQEMIELATQECSYPLQFRIISTSRRCQVHGNGRMVGRFNIPVVWPKLMRQLSSLAVSVFMDKLRPSQDAKAHAAAGTELNSRLHQLHVFVTGQTNIRRLQIKLISQLQLSDSRLHDILSPLLCTGGKVDKIECCFIDVSESFQVSFYRRIAAFSTLRSMEPELREVLRLRAEMGLYGFWSKESIDSYKALFKPMARDGVMRLANEIELEDVTGELKMLFKNTWKYDTKGKLKAEWEARKQLTAE